ncbi:hydroxyisourate hydrolase [Salinisphaera sp. SPP-AMP-43]|uniref:hydroxyisourate hydrolase n=1 Tax=Salinisphaera sp. SPP-AMP-43 TaxID=3121288 RepID=UPI003C6E4454
MGYLTTHVLDTANGCPGAGIRIELARLAPGGQRTLLATAETNADGRTDQPLLSGAAFVAGRYELMLSVSAYYATRGSAHAGDFLDDVVIRFVVSSPQEHYHVPLLVSPYGYSTYRGS